MFASFSSGVSAILQRLDARSPKCRSLPRMVLALVALVLQGCSRAPTVPLAGPDPSNPTQQAAPSRYHSTTESYVRRRPVEPLPWIEQNRRVTPAPKS